MITIVYNLFLPYHKDMSPVTQLSCSSHHAKKFWSVAQNDCVFGT